MIPSKNISTNHQPEPAVSVLHIKSIEYATMCTQPHASGQPKYVLVDRIEMARETLGTLVRPIDISRTIESATLIRWENSNPVALGCNTLGLVALR